MEALGRCYCSNSTRTIAVCITNVRPTIRSIVCTLCLQASGMFYTLPPSSSRHASCRERLSSRIVNDLIVIEMQRNFHGYHSGGRTFAIFDRVEIRRNTIHSEFTLRRRDGRIDQGAMTYVQRCYLVNTTEMIERTFFGVRDRHS